MSNPRKAIEFYDSLDDYPPQEVKIITAYMECPMCKEAMRNMIKVRRDASKELISAAKDKLVEMSKGTLFYHMRLVHMEDTVCPHCKSTDVTRHDLQDYQERLTIDDEFVRYWLSCDNCKRIGKSDECITYAIRNFLMGAEDA